LPCIGGGGGGLVVGQHIASGVAVETFRCEKKKQKKMKEEEEEEEEERSGIGQHFASAAVPLERWLERLSPASGPAQRHIDAHRPKIWFPSDTHGWVYISIYIAVAIDRNGTSFLYCV
jgi:hypothetical protein